MLLLFKVIDSERAQVFSHIDDHDVILLEKLFNQVNTHSLVQWSVVLEAFQKNKLAADDQTLYVFNAGKNLSFLYQVNVKTQTIKIDAVPYGNMIWDEEVFFLDALAETQKISRSLPKGLMERIPDFKGHFETEVTLHFSLNCAGKIGLGSLIDGSIKENRKARQKLIEIAEPYAKNLSKSFLRTIKFKQYTEAVQNLHPLSVNLKMTFEELTEKLLFLNHANTQVKSFTQNELVQILDQIPGKELEVPTPQEFDYMDLSTFLNRFYYQKFEKIKSDFQTIENKNMIIEDIHAGQGVCLIDPHGVDILDVLANIPKERYEDVIYFDPSNTERPMALNMLEYDIRFPEQKTFVVNELFSIFQKLYSGSPESMGPMFEQYFRNATMLVIEDPDSGNTLIDVSRVLADKTFRNLKLDRCKNPIVVQFWREVAEKAGG